MGRPMRPTNAITPYPVCPWIPLDTDIWMRKRDVFVAIDVEFVIGLIEMEESLNYSVPLTNLLSIGCHEFRHVE